MFRGISELVRDAWKWILSLIVIAGVMLLAFPVNKNTAERVDCGSNLEKFNSIGIDLAAAGVDQTAVLEQFMVDPVSWRMEVVQHKRKRFMLISVEAEYAAAKQFVSAMKSMNILWHDKQAIERCNSILKRLSGVMPENFTPPEQIYILDTPQVNAYCLPGGEVIVFRGLVEIFDDDELAWVIAHELGHGSARHSAEMVSKAMVQDLAIEAFTEAESNHFYIIGGNIAAYIANLKYSRIQEDEADRLALFYMNKAGFDMQGAVRVLSVFRMDAGENVRWKEWLSTHPHPENRLQNIVETIGQLQANPDHSWGGLKDLMLEEAKAAAIRYYMKKKNNN